MKRRTLLSLGLGGLSLAVGRRYLSSCPQSTLAVAAPPVHDRPFRFAVVGDVGTGKKGQYNVASAMMQRWQSNPYDLALLAGDNIYDNGEIEKIERVFERPYAELLQRDVRFRAVLGNHDVRTQRGELQIAYPGYHMPSRYYTFTQQSVQFFALDTNQAAGKAEQAAAWQTQLQWLNASLAQSRAQWKIVFAHHPIYSSGSHGFNAALANDLVPIFAEHGVQLYINGHDHHYERTESIDGTTYITSGNGAKLRRVGQSDWTAFASSQLGFTMFNVQRDRIVISAIDTRNNIYDEALII